MHKMCINRNEPRTKPALEEQLQLEKARSWGCQEEKESWQGEERGEAGLLLKEEKEEWEEEWEGGGRGRGRGPCHFADNNPSLTVGVKQQVQSASSLPQWKQLTG